MLKSKLSLWFAAALVFITSFDAAQAQTAAAKQRAVVKATVGTGGPSIITTVAGGFNNDGVPATNAAIFGAYNVTFDGTGNMYVADYRGNRIRKVDARTGIITTLIGTGESKWEGLGGPAAKMSLVRPIDVAADAVGNVYFNYPGGTYKLDPSGTVTLAAAISGPYMCTDSAGNLYLTGSQIRKVDAKTGIITYMAGAIIPRGANGPFVDDSGNLYCTGNNQVLKVAPSGAITIVAGSGSSVYAGDGGAATKAGLHFPGEVFVDNTGNVFIAESGRVRKVDGKTGIISTAAGNGKQGFSGDGGPATEASLGNYTWGFAVDGAGNIYIADADNKVVRKVDARTGIITTVAGGGDNWPGDGKTATAASLGYPTDVFVDREGNLIIADLGAHRIRKVDGKTGIITTVAGDGFFADQNFDGRFAGDGGPATAASLNRPGDLFIDGSGNLFISDEDNQRVRRVDANTGIITTVAGNGKQGFSGDGGPAAEASLNNPRDLYVDGSGNLYIGDQGNNRIRKVDTKAGVITTVVGDPGSDGDGRVGTNTRINAADMYVDDSGNLYFAEQNNHRVRKVDAKTGIVTTIAGSGQSGFSGDGGPATSARLNGPRGVYADGVGNVYITDTNNQRVRKVDASGVITTFAGGGILGPPLAEGGPATQASLGGPIGIVGDRSGNIRISESFNRVRMVNPSGIITTVAGGGFFGEGGPATATWLTPRDICVDGAGNLYMADVANNRVRKVDANGVITTVAGNGIPGFSTDGGRATETTVTPNAVFVDGAGNLLIGGNARLRKVDAKTGIITTVAGTETSGFSGDGGPATGAGFSISDFFMDSAGNTYIADNLNHRVRKVDANTGTITTVAGTGEAGYSGDGGPATAARLNNPTWVFVDGSGNLYLSDQGNNRVRKVDAKTGIISTVAGDGTAGNSGDGGPATAARLNAPMGLFVDSAGNLYITDQNNNRIRRVNASGAITTVVGNSPVGFLGDGGEPFNASLFAPTTVFLDGAGNLYIADSAGNYRVRKVAAPSVKGVEVAFSRSVSGRAADYKWRGTADASGQVTVEIVADPPKVGPANASGYYVARATDAVSGAILGMWSSIPINGGKEITLSLPIGGLVNVLGVRALESSGSLSLHANSPNPFNPATQIAYELPEAGEVTLTIYNVLGQQVRALAQGRQEAGFYRVTWDGRDANGRAVSSGVYLYRLEAGGFVQTRRMLLMK